MSITRRISAPLHPIARRRAEIERERAVMRDREAALQAELKELDVAERVLSRLSGAGNATGGNQDRPKPKSASEAQAGGSPAMPVMIRTVLAEAYRQGLRGLEPREISDRIDEKPSWGPINRDVIRTRAWRLAQEGKLRKEGSVYSLVDPENEKPADDNSEGNESAGLFGIDRKKAV